jgi:hypothetical protein
MRAPKGEYIRGSLTLIGSQHDRFKEAAIGSGVSELWPT